MGQTYTRSLLYPSQSESPFLFFYTISLARRPGRSVETRGPRLPPLLHPRAGSPHSTSCVWRSLPYKPYLTLGSQHMTYTTHCATRKYRQYTGDSTARRARQHSTYILWRRALARAATKLVRHAATKLGAAIRHQTQDEPHQTREEERPSRRASSRSDQRRASRARAGARPDHAEHGGEAEGQG